MDMGKEGGGVGGEACGAVSTALRGKMQHHCLPDEGDHLCEDGDPLMIEGQAEV